MKVLVFGATGKTGSAVVERAVAAGHDVTAFVRGFGEGRTSNVSVAQGDATNRADVDAAMHGQEAVINTIGGKTPWKHTVLESTSAKTIIASMLSNRVSRLLVTSMLGVGESKQHTSIFVRLLIATFLRGADRDKSAMESAVEASGLNWTILRPAILTDDAMTGSIRIFQNTTNDKARKMTRNDLAAFMVDQLVSNAYLHRSVTIANH